jgi:diguanylate cyclase (GGDEF)-like protein/PAS domain S-box-containing protein
MSKRNDEILSLLEALKHQTSALLANQLLYTEMVDNNADGLLVVDGDGIIQFANKMAAEMFNRKKAKKLEGEIFAFNPVEHETAEIEIATEKNMRTVEMRSSKIEWAGSAAMLVVLRSATDRGKVRSSLQKASESLKAMTNASPLAIIVVDIGGVITLWSKAAERIFEWSEHEMRGQSFPFNDSPLEEILERAAAGEHFFEHEISGSYGLYGLAKTLHLWASPLNNAAGATNGVMLMVADITEKKLQKLQLESALRDTESLATFALHHDALTGLPNRALFRDRLQQALILAQSEGIKSLAVMHFGVDQFKTINQCFGHAIGDQLLLDVGTRMAGVMYEIDTVSRVGGDEFLILVHNIQDSHDAAPIVRKIMESLQQPFLLNGQEIYITASIGVAVHPNDGATADDLLKNADAAMHRAKEDLGRGNYQFFCADMNSHAMHKLMLEGDLRRALEHDEFHLHYQPQVDTQSNVIIGAEALLRWNHPQQGNIPPGEFIPAAESCGVIEPIGDWVLQTACLQHRAWIEAGLSPIRIAVNLSARQFLRGDLLDKVARALKASGMQPEYLELELTESMLMHDVENTVKTLRELKQMGVRLSIDDFGTGYSSLSYLKRFPLDILKIDRSFVTDLGTESDDGEIARAIIAMAHALRLEVVAEGVENRQQLDFMRDSQCDFIQGYFFSKPLPAEEFARLLKGKTLGLFVVPNKAHAA